MKPKKKECFKAFVLLYITLIYGALISSGYVHAEEIVLLPEISMPAESNTFVGVRGAYLEAVHVLDRMNEIRRQACEDGVPNPANPSVNLTMNDYIPLKWSKEIENYCRIRAAEAFICMEHRRFNGRGIYTKTSSGINTNAEVLACEGEWPFDESEQETDVDISFVNMWASEKESWVNRTSGAVTGHYTSMINPNTRYVGVGIFLSKENGMYAAAGQFSSSVPKDQDGNEISVDETRLAAVNDCVQLIEMNKSYITGPEITTKLPLPYNYLTDWERYVASNPNVEKPKVAGDSNEYECIYWIVSEDLKEEVDRVLVPGNIFWSSANTNIATVDQTGVVSYKKKGTTTISASSDYGMAASSQLTVKYDKPTKPTIKSLKGGKKSFTIKVKSNKKTVGYEIEYSKDKKFRKGVYGDSWVKELDGNKLSFKVKKKGTYYVRVKANRVIGEYPFLSDWTKAKKVKVK